MLSRIVEFALLVFPVFPTGIDQAAAQLLVLSGCTRVDRGTLQETLEFARLRFRAVLEDGDSGVREQAGT